MSPFNKNLINTRLEHEARRIIANGFSHSPTERIIALKVAQDINNQDQMLTSDEFLVGGF